MRDEPLKRPRTRSAEAPSQPLSRRARRELELREAQQEVLTREQASAAAEPTRTAPGRRSLRQGLPPADYDAPAIPAPDLQIEVVSSKTASIPVDEILAEIAEPPATRARGRRAKPLEAAAPETQPEVAAAPQPDAAAAPQPEASAAPLESEPLASAPLEPTPLPAHIPADAAETPLDETDDAADRPTELLLRELELETLTIEPITDTLDPLPLETDEIDDPLSPVDAPVHIAAPTTSRRRPAAKRVRRVRTAWRPAARADRRKEGPTPSAPRPSSSAVRRPAWFKGLFSGVAMLFVLGMTAVMAIPSTVSASPIDAGIVQSALTANTPGQELATTNSASSATVDRDGYAVSDAGELQAAGYSSAQMLVGRQLAQEIMAAVASGKLVGSVPDHIKEIQYIADGVTVPDCGVDYRILEIIVIALHNFDQVGVSDINRKCTGQIEGAGTASSHYIDGGGHAVDFYLLNKASLNGADANTLKLISILDPIMPKGAHVGQAECRASAGIKLSFTNWTEFDDSCTHMHIDVPVTDAPLLLTDSSILAQ